MQVIYTHVDHIVPLKIEQNNTNTSRNPWRSINTLRLAIAIAEAFRAIARRTEQDGMEDETG